MQAPAPGAPGAATPRAAVTAFMAGVKAGDLQAISAVWGTSAGSIRNDIPEPELSKREIYIISCTKHDKFKINSEATGQAGRRVLAVDITSRGLDAVDKLHCGDRSRKSVVRRESGHLTGARRHLPGSLTAVSAR